MSRHRHVKAMIYDEEYDDYDDDNCGHSTDEEACISPTDSQQWLYDRARNQASMTSFLAKNKNIEEDEEPIPESLQNVVTGAAGASNTFEMPKLSEEEEVCFQICIDEIRNVFGQSVSHEEISKLAIKNKFNVDKCMDDILNNPNSIGSTTKTPITDKAGPKIKLELLPPQQSTQSPSILTASTSSTLISTPKLPSKLIQNTDTLITPTNSTTTTTTTTTTANKLNIAKPFNISAVNSPIFQSPRASKRNSSNENSSDDEEKSINKSSVPVKQLNRNVSELFVKERAGEKEHLHMVVIGHVDAGKSTLMGHTLYELGDVSQQIMHKYERESQKMGKQSFKYAWVLDATGEERERGITMDVATTVFVTETKIVTLLDAPGHQDFIPNMISGASQADVALLVLDATRGEFETGFEQGGQTREHALLVRSIGVSQLSVVVNKLDTCNWSQERFDEIVTKMKVFLKQIGYKESDVSYIPCSGLTGENLVRPATESNLISWYSGPTLIQLIDKFKIPERNMNKPFRMTISDIFKSQTSGVTIAGRIETGVLCTNDKILICPLKQMVTVKTVLIDDVSKAAAFAGDHVQIILSGIDMDHLFVGAILSDIIKPIPIATRIEARILIFNLKVALTLGSPVVLHYQSLIQPAIFVKLRAQLHKQTGEIMKKNPRCLLSNCCALVEIETTKPMAIERYSDFKELGRIMLRIGGVTVAVGFVTNILK